jgi:hypothetical protein
MVHRLSSKMKKYFAASNPPLSDAKIYAKRPLLPHTIPDNSPSTCTSPIFVWTKPHTIWAAPSGQTLRASFSVKHYLHISPVSLPRPGNGERVGVRGYLVLR